MSYKWRFDQSCRSSGESAPRAPGLARQGGFGFCNAGMTAANAVQALGPRSVNENVKSIAALLQDALAGAPHNHAIPHVRCFLDGALREGGHGVGIEKVGRGPDIALRTEPPCQSARTR